MNNLSTSVQEEVEFILQDHLGWLNEPGLIANVGYPFGTIAGMRNHVVSARSSFFFTNALFLIR